MIFLDTHVALWLYAEVFRIPPSVRRRLDESELFVSPMARLEMSFLHEIGRLLDDPEGVIEILKRDLCLTEEQDGWLRAAQVARHLSWTRDPFDRLITAHAICFSAPLCSRDETIRRHYRHAFWT